MGILNVPIDSPFIVFASKGPFYWEISWKLGIDK